LLKHTHLCRVRPSRRTVTVELPVSQLDYRRRRYTVQAGIVNTAEANGGSICYLAAVLDSTLHLRHVDAYR